MPTRAVNVKTDPFDVYVGRSMRFHRLEAVRRASPWANPYKLDRDGDRPAIMRKYRADLVRIAPATTVEEALESLPSSARPTWRRQLARLGAGVSPAAELRKLRGKRLGCWCKPEACHADILAELADGPARHR